MYSFEHKDTEDHPVKDTSIVLENVAHRVKDCLEQLLEEDFWDSASATQTRTFDVYITVFAEITNSDDVNGLGRLFPNVTIGG